MMLLMAPRAKNSTFVEEALLFDAFLSFDANEKNAMIRPVKSTTNAKTMTSAMPLLDDLNRLLDRAFDKMRGSIGAEKPAC